ncbi:hypothetical protein M433DRAFT_43283, partial [Acidomyces richmondensis BFW]
RASQSPNYASIAKKHGVERTTLSRRARAIHSSRTAQYERQQRTLINYINKLSEAGLPPTPAMVCHFA